MDKSEQNQMPMVEFELGRPHNHGGWILSK
jgi:hypothetical protein